MAAVKDTTGEEFAKIGLTLGGIWLGFASGLFPALIGAVTKGVGGGVRTVTGQPTTLQQQTPAAPAAGANPGSCAGWNRQLSADELSKTGMAAGHTVADLFNAQYGSDGFNRWRGQGGVC